MMVLGWPQIVWIALGAMALGIELTRSGQPKTGHHSFGTTLVAVAISNAILWWGGFFG